MRELCARRVVLEIPPCFRVIRGSAGAEDDGAIVVVPGTGFGDGRHETTQLCLQAIAHFAPRPRRPFRLLDVGSGSGILSIGAAKLGGTAVGVEIDRAANEGARENARRSGVANLVRFSEGFPEAGEPFELVVANILRDVLVTLAETIVGRLAPGGTLVLSGLVGTDVPAVSGRYAALLGGQRPEIYERGEWRALVWRGG